MMFKGRIPAGRRARKPVTVPAFASLSCLYPGPVPRKSSTVKSEMPALELARAAAFRSQLRQFLRRTQSVATRAGLTSHRYDLLLMIKSAAEDGRELRLTDLHELMHLQQTAVTELVKRTEQAGLIHRRPSPDDRRVSLLALTAEGERRLLFAFNALREDRQALAVAFGELDQLFRAQSGPTPSTRTRRT